MNLRKLSIIACVVICGALVAHAVQDGMEDMQKKWMDYMTPGKQHQEMAASAGKWDVKSSFWMMPGGEPMVSSAKSTIETSMDNRYLIENFEGTMMGMPYQGMGLFGYDNLTKKYWGTWVDSMGTGPTNMSGTRTGNKVEYHGTMADVMAGKHVPVRFVQTTIDADHHTLEMFSKGPDGKEFRGMFLEYSRQGAQ